MQNCMMRMLALPGLFVALAVLSLPAVSQADETFEVTYRLASWKTKHFETEADARKDAGFLQQKLGCEVRLDSHDGHFDVAYRCPQWKSLKFPSHDATHEWEKWLKQRGFETHHEH
jgi:hypothetical protein